LLSGNTKSCGCLNRELSSKRQRIKNTGKKGIEHPMYGKRGKLSPNYGKRKKNPKSKEALLIRMSFDYKNWRKNVFERDDYTCQKCFVIGGNLNAHHISSFNNNPDLRFKLENGLTLCESCHYKFHNKYGFGNNSIKQIEIFLHDGTI
jgi:predicted HNH restriction endonuclease